MKTVFVDTNVILDVLLQNDGFWQDSLKVYQLAELRQIDAYVSASSITDIFYVARKILSISVAREAIEKLLSIFHIVGVDGDDLRGALALSIDDMEDALQAWSAKKANVDAIISRDTNGFAGIDIPTIAPVDFLV